MKATTIIGIAGGSGSGKTTVTNEIMKNLEGHSVALDFRRAPRNQL